MKKVLFLVLMVVVFGLLFSCTDAMVASHNVSKAADQFEVYRRVVFYNGITNEYMLVVEGYSSIHADREDDQLELTVKVGPNQFIKHYLGLSDNVTYFAEQIDPSQVSDGRYRIIFKPSVIVPNIDLE
jgi:hypothetical protein